MRTTWGEVEIQDAHAHFFSRSFFASFAWQKGVADTASMVDELGWDLPPERNEDLARDWAGELDRHGVAKSVLMASVPGDETAVAEAVRAFPGRFYGYFMLDPLAPAAQDRARTAFEDLGLQGLCLFPAMHRFSVQDDRLAPLYGLAAEAGNRVVFVHMGVLTVGIRSKLGLPSEFNMSYSNPIDLHGVAMDHPYTNFVLPHFGAGYFREALMLASLAPNVYLDTSSSNSWRRYLSPSPSLQEVFAQALDVVGPERLLFGSDSSFFPRGWNRAVIDEQREALARAGASQSDAESILGANLARLLGRRDER